MSTQEPFAVLTSAQINSYRDGGGAGCDGAFTLLCGGPVQLSADAIQLLCPPWMTSHKVLLLADGTFTNAVAFVPKGAVGRIFRVSLMAMGVDRVQCVQKLEAFRLEILSALRDPVTIGTMLDTRAL